MPRSPATTPQSSFVMTGGGTGGHVFPALAVARILEQRGHQVLFVGTQQGMESRLVPQAGFRIEFIRSGALNRAGLWRQLRTLFELPLGIISAYRLLGRARPDAVFSMGGYAAGPMVAATLLRRIPLIVMEPNAIPGITNRVAAKLVYRALLGFEATRAWFPASRSEVTGLPVRPEFFAVTAPRNNLFTVLITGGSRGARTLNRASRASWKLFRDSRVPVRIVHQSGPADAQAMQGEFAASGLEGEVVPFIGDMACMFGQADLVIGRAGAGGVSEIAAAGVASVLVPLPFAADDHQRKNALQLVEAGAARMVPDAELDGPRLFQEVEALRANPGELGRMRERVRSFAKPGAAERAAQVLEEAADAKRMPQQH